MATYLSGVRVGEVSWQEVDKRLHAGAMALLPIGAAAKSHGAHLPMNADFIQAEWLAEQLMGQGNILVWPTVGYGYYPAFLQYPGSCSIPSQTFQEVIRNILENIIRAGARHILLINTGISTIKPIEEAVEIFPANERPVIAHVYRGKRFLGVAAKIQQQAFGGHADELETSIMLAIAPQLVDLSQAQPWDTKELQPGPLQRADPTHPNYSPQGICGDPTLATVEKGQLLVQAMLDDLREFLQTQLRR